MWTEAEFKPGLNSGRISWRKALSEPPLLLFRVEGQAHAQASALPAAAAASTPGVFTHTHTIRQLAETKKYSTFFNEVNW